MPETPMPTMAPEDLRHVLRLGTREDHERLDAQMGACDLTTRDGMTRFLLADLGCTAPLPALPALMAEGAAGAAYVLIGSRLGTAVLRSQGYWSPGLPAFSRYMEDNSLRALWQPLVKGLRDLPQARHDGALATARAAFLAFEQGLHLAQGMPLQNHEGALPS